MSKILTFEEGEVFRNQMVYEYRYEFELVCINAQARGLSREQVQSELNQALLLNENYPGKTIVRESEFHEADSPYYEVSVFCFQDEKKEVKKHLKDNGYLVDIVHDLKDYPNNIC